MYEVRITPEGLRHLNRLSAKVRDAALAAVLGPISENPRRLGKALVGELAGLYSARRGDYRIIYEIDDAARRGQADTGFLPRQVPFCSHHVGTMSP